MNTVTPAAPEDFAAELVRRGLPVEYARRAASEIGDHHRDLVSELRAVGKDDSIAEYEAARRLGDTRTLIKKTVREYQRRHWCGRWPLLTFLFGPVVLLLAAWTGTILTLLAIGYALEAAGFHHDADGVISKGERIGMWCVVGWFVFVLPASVLLLLSRLGARAALGHGWIAVAAIVLALNVGTMEWGSVKSLRPTNKIRNAATKQVLPPDRFIVSTPLWVFFSSASHAFNFLTRSPQQLGQFLMPVVIGALAVWQNQRAVRRWQRELAGVC
jgi:hypothetical protein